MRGHPTEAARPDPAATDPAAPDLTVPDLNPALPIYRHSLLAPQALALAGDGHALTYAELVQRAAGLAARLRQARTWPRAGAPRPRVGVLASRSIDACVAALAAFWAGAVYVPLGNKAPAQRLVQLLAQCELSALVADAQGASILGDAAAGRAVLAAGPPCVCVPDPAGLVLPAGSAVEVELVSVDALSAMPAAAPVAPPVDPPAAMVAGDTAYIIFTSGTTGVPKGVVIPAGAMAAFLGAMAGVLGLGPQDRVLGTFESTFDVSIQDMFCTWQAGASLHLLPATQVMNAARMAREQRLTVWASVPSLVALLRQVRAIEPGSLPDLRRSMFGGEPLPVGLAAAWRAAAPNSTVENHYGPTEATVACLRQPVGAAPPLTPGRDCVALGRPLPGCDIAVLDEAGEQLPDGCRGELAIAGAQLADGYLGQAALSAACFPTLRGRRWYRTGDLALRDAAGVFHGLGRIDHQVKVLGHRIELEEVDAHLRAATGVDLVGTIAWPVVDGSARGLVGFVGARSVDAACVVRDLRARLPAYMVPGQVLALAELPLGPNGKVDRGALRQLLDTDRLP